MAYSPNNDYRFEGGLMRHFRIYTKEGCAHCVNAKALLNSYGFEYEEMSVTDHPEILEIFKTLNWRSFPLVVEKVKTSEFSEKNTTIGGFNELKDYLDDEL